MIEVVACARLWTWRADLTIRRSSDSYVATPAPPAAPLVRMARVIRAPSSSTSRGSVVIDVLDLRTRVTVEAGVERETLAAVFGALGIVGAR